MLGISTPIPCLFRDKKCIGEPRHRLCRLPVSHAVITRSAFVSVIQCCEGYTMAMTTINMVNFQKELPADANIFARIPEQKRLPTRT